MINQQRQGRCATKRCSPKSSRPQRLSSQKMSSVLCYWKFATLASVLIGALALTGMIVYFVTIHQCQIPTVYHTSNVKIGEQFTLSHKNALKIQYCSFKTPFSEIQEVFHNSSQDEEVGILTIEDGRVQSRVSGTRCIVTVTKAMLEDEGLWKFYVGTSSNKYFERTRHFYNISVLNTPIASIPARNISRVKDITFSATTKNSLSTPADSEGTTNTPETITNSTHKSNDYTKCSSEWSIFANYCYKLFDNNVYIERKEAARICKSKKSYLSSINSLEEQIFVLNFVSQKYPAKKVWLGGVQTRDIWMWDDGKVFDYTNWYLKEPDSVKRCMYMNHLTKYAWHDASCGADGKRWGISILLCKKPI